MSSPLAPIAAGLLDAFAPLDRALRDAHAFRVLLRNLGWEKTFDDAALSRPPLADVAAACAELLASGRAIAADAQDHDAVFEELFDIVGALQDLVAAFAELDTAGLPPGLSDPDFWAQLALELPEFLTVRYLDRHQPVLNGLLRLAGVIEDDPDALEPAGDRLPWVRRRIVWDHLVALVGGPADHLQSLYGWGEGRFDHARLLGEIARFAATAGVRIERLPLRPALQDAFYAAIPPPDDVREAALPIVRGRVDGSFSEQGVLLAPVPRTPTAAVDGLYVTSLSYGEAPAAGFTVAPGWTLTATGTAGAHLRPGVVQEVDGSAELAVVGVAPDGAPWRLLGAATGPRIELGGLRLALAFTAALEPDLTVSARALPTADRGGIAVTIDPSQGDGFLQRLMPVSVRADADAELRWSARNGVSLGGTAGLDVVVPIEKTLGPVNVNSLHFALTGGEGSATFLAAITGGVSLPPLDVLIMDVGLELELVPGASDSLVDGLGMAVRFKPPLGVGLELDMDAAEGGGFIGHDPDTGRYWGNLSLTFGEYGIGAICVVDTRLPGDPQWALFASISGTWPGLPLGFGFLLTGVGGILALNRTMDVEALAAGLKSGAADAIMFPDDPLGDAALIVSELDAWFPIADGSFVFGIAAQIAWGAKALITAELGIVISFPDLDIVVLGTITSILPDDEKAQLELHMDTLGVIDLGEGTIWITSALYDSALVHTLHLSGESALYARFTNEPFFLLSVGGYHPAFQPPGGLPGALYDLDRMRASIDISEDVYFALEAYFAITSNTLQFGSQATLEASSKFLGVTYRARGEVGFDVLLVFSPFSFSVDFEVSVTITAGSGDHELLAVSLAAHLEGPQPWACSGHARFTFLGIDVGFEFDVGGNLPAAAPATENVLVLVVAALREAAAWRPVAPGATPVLLAEAAAVEGEVWAAPDADLEAVQDVAPLERELDHYGAYAVSGPRVLTIAAAGVDGAGQALTWTTSADYFAPAQYDDLSRSEKLSAPSYEAMTAGVRFGIDGIAVPADDEARAITARYERAVIDGPVRTGLKADGLAVSMETASFGHVVASGRSVAAETGPFALEPVTWVTADAVTGRSTGKAGSYRTAVLAERDAPRGSARVAPAYALRPTFRFPGPIDFPTDPDDFPPGPGGGPPRGSEPGRKGGAVGPERRGRS